MNAIQQRDNGAVITIRVIPRASKNEACGFFGDALKIKLTAPPAEGKANRELISFLSVKLGVRPRRIELLAGKTGRLKRVFIAGLSAEDVRKRLIPVSADFR